MNRRNFLGQLAVSGAATGALAAASAINVVERAAAEPKEQLSARLEALEAKFDKLEHHHKNLIRVGGIAFALSTGVDVVSFL